MTGLDYYGRRALLGFSAEDLGTIFKAGGEIAQGAMTMKEKADAEAKAKSDEAERVRAAVAADVEAVAAAARAAISKKPDDDEDAKSLVAAADSAAADLSPEGARMRVDAARKASSAAAAAARAKPKDVMAVAMARAWTGALAKISAPRALAPASGTSKPVASDGGRSWWTEKVADAVPVPRWGALGALALLVGGGLALRSRG